MSSTPETPNPYSGSQPGTGQPHPVGQQPQPAGQAQQYGSEGGKYGTAEYNPDQYTGLVERPSVLDRLLKLTLASAALYLVSAVVNQIISTTVDQEQVLRNMGASSEEATRAATGSGMFGGLIGTILGTVIALGLYYLVYSGLKKGKNWARILGTVFAALAILGALYSIITMLFLGGFGYGTVAIVVTLILTALKLVVDVLWIITAFKAPNNAYFGQNRKR